MNEGIYKAEFRVGQSAGYGTVTLLNGRIRGGDASMYYVGTYEVHGDALRAELHVDRHTAIPGSRSVFGVDRVAVALRGHITGDEISAQGSPTHAPGVVFQVILKWLAD